jgi:hypothetical protein
MRLGAITPPCLDELAGWRSNNMLIERLWHTLKHEESVLRLMPTLEEANAVSYRVLASTTAGDPHQALGSRSAGGGAA